MFKKMILIFLILSFSLSYANADWLGKVKEKASSIVERTREVTRGASSKARRGVEKIKEKYNKEKVQEFSRKVKEFGKKIKKNLSKGAIQGKKIYELVKENYNKKLQKIRDPELRRKARKLLDDGLALRRSFLDDKNKGIGKSINALSRFPVPGGITFGEMIKRKMGKKYPALENAGILDEDTVIAFVLTDKSYFLKEVEIVNVGGENVSVIDAIGRSSSFDVEETMKYLRVAGALEQIGSAGDVGGAVDGLLGAMDAVK